MRNLKNMKRIVDTSEVEEAVVMLLAVPIKSHGLAIGVSMSAHPPKSITIIVKLRCLSGKSPANGRKRRGKCLV